MATKFMNQEKVVIELAPTPNDLPRRLPEKAHATDSGYDLFASIVAELPPHSTMMIQTGWMLANLTTGWELQVRPRSGMAVKYSVQAVLGTVDFSFAGELNVILQNISAVPYQVHVGDKIAQLVVAPLIESKILQVQQIVDRGGRQAKGWGSTGR